MFPPHHVPPVTRIFPLQHQGQRLGQRLPVDLDQREQRLPDEVLGEEDRVRHVIASARVGHQLPQSVVLHRLGQVHEDVVAVRVNNSEELK